MAKEYGYEETLRKYGEHIGTSRENHGQIHHQWSLLVRRSKYIRWIFPARPRSMTGGLKSQEIVRRKNPIWSMHDFQWFKNCHGAKVQCLQHWGSLTYDLFAMKIAESWIRRWLCPHAPRQPNGYRQPWYLGTRKEENRCSPCSKKNRQIRYQ